MDRRSFGIAVTMFWLASAATAQQPAAVETAKTPAAKVEETAKLKAVEAPIQLAERLDAAQPAVPAKKRVARVTTCRCGDPASQQ